MISYVDIVLFLTTVFLVTYVYGKYSFNYWKRKGIPQSSMDFPFGALKGICSTWNAGTIIQNKYHEAKSLPYYGLNYMFSPVLLVRDPELIKDILIKEFSKFYDRGLHVNYERNPLTYHLIFLTGKQWRNMRIRLTPAFTSGKMKFMFPTMVQSSEEMVNYLKSSSNNGEAVDVKEVFAKYSMNVIARCGFGLELDSFKKENTKFRNVGQAFTDPTYFGSYFVNLLFFSAPRLFVNLPFSIFPKDVTKFFIGVVDDTMKQREQDNIKRNDFMQLLMQLKDKGVIEDSEASKQDSLLGENEDASEAKKKITVEEAASSAFQFFIAGFETTSNALQFALFELASNQDIQDRLRSELDNAISADEKVTYDVIHDLKYLDQIISETLRKYPATSFIQRECTSPYKLPNTDVILDPGTRVVISSAGLHSDPIYYPEPEKFDPERFSPENVKNIKPFTYLPFGDGPRACIGMRFAQMEMKIGLAQFILRYKVDLCDRSPKPPLQFNPRALLNGLKGKMYLKVSNR